MADKQDSWWENKAPHLVDNELYHSNCPSRPASAAEIHKSVKNEKHKWTLTVHCSA